jgi:hypothetical protein
MVTRGPHVDREPMLKEVTLFLEQTASRFRFMTIPELPRQACPQPPVDQGSRFDGTMVYICSERFVQP